MSLLTIDQNPTITDTVLFDLYTTDANGNLVNPYEVNQVTIYFVERDYTSSNLEEFDMNIQGFATSFHYNNAAPIAVFGSDDFPAWLSSDTADAFLTKVDFTPTGNVDTGHFQLQWTPSENTQAREGDYFLCMTWTPIAAGDSYSKIIYFYLGGNGAVPTVPSHQTNPVKYPTLLDRYTPDMFKQFLATADITPQVIQSTNLAVADGFTDLENLANQMVDLYDANVVQEVFLPYLANMFRWTLRSNDPTLWRRQVRQAIPLYKQKGTLGGLTEALAESGVEFRKLTYYWQIVSKATWQEAFIVQPGQTTFCLSKRALPVDNYNFAVWRRPNGSPDYTEVPLTDVQFVTNATTNNNCENNVDYTSCVNWTSTTTTLQAGDVVRILYKIAEPGSGDCCGPFDQQIESYIQTLPLADQRDEITVTCPVKNWNVRLIAEDDFLFPVIVSVKHPFAYPVVWGKIRTEFPYSEKIYNMEEYNGSIRDSENPCDMDCSFLDTCSACRSSKISIDVAIEDLSNDRISEVEEIVRDFLPFHAVVQSINYVGLQDEIIPPPIEELECLIQYNLSDDIIFSQFDFDRLIVDGRNPQNIKRDMLANAEAVATGNDAVGSNLAVSIFSPGIQFGSIGINDESNYLEILSGTNEGQYSLQQSTENMADVVGISQYPLDTSGFPFRFSNVQYTEMGASVYQDNFVTLTDSSVDFALFPIPDGGTWVIQVTSGPNVGTYPILQVKPDNTLVIGNWTGGNASGLSYQLNAPGNINVMNGVSGQATVRFRGRLQTQLLDLNSVKKDDYVLMGGSQYKILFVAVRQANAASDSVYIDGYTGGDQVGNQNIKILRRLLDNVVGYLTFRGLKLHTTINYESSLGIQDGANPVSVPLENSDFIANYLILIGTTYYQMSNINGQDIYLSGPLQNWGLVGQNNIGYTIIQLVNQPATIQSGYDEEYRTFNEPFIDRRGEGTFLVEQNLNMAPPTFRMHLLNKLNEGEMIEDCVKAKESITYTVVIKEE